MAQMARSAITSSIHPSLRRPDRYLVSKLLSLQVNSGLVLFTLGFLSQ